MIDKVELYKVIDLNKELFNSKFRYVNETIDPEIDRETGKVIRGVYKVEHYIYKHNGLAIKYIISSRKLCVKGRLVNVLKERTLFSNLSDYILDKESNELIIISNQNHFNNQAYDYRETCSYIVNKVNNLIESLIDIPVDIGEFKVKGIEPSFNLFNIEYVGYYIELFNLIFASKERKNHKNHVLEKNLSHETSFYVKRLSSYKENKKDSYAVNFYNKQNQLEYLKSEEKKNSKILDESIKLAKNLLRLEVQLHGEELNKRENTFNYYLDINNCLDEIIRKYRQFISRNENLNFYSYDRAKNIIEETNLLNENNKKLLLKHIKEKYAYNKKHNPNTITKYNKMLKILGIDPFFIPTKWKIDYLESPINIIKRVYNI